MTKQHCLWLLLAGVAGCNGSSSQTASGAITSLALQVELLAGEPAEAARAQRKVILYIGDGGGTCGAEAEPAYLERLCDEVTRRNGGRAAIHAIGVDAGPCGQGMLLYLTERNCGSYRRLVRKK